jgi:hypothetical protein
MFSDHSRIVSPLWEIVAVWKLPTNCNMGNEASVLSELVDCRFRKCISNSIDEKYGDILWDGDDRSSVEEASGDDCLIVAVRHGLICAV